MIRGVRFAYKLRGYGMDAKVEYFSDPTDERDLSLNFSLGVYGGLQRFEADYLAGDDRSEILTGLSGRVQGTVLDQFELTAEADLPLAARIGQGRVSGILSWTLAERFALSAQAIFERSEAPWTAGLVGANDQLVFSNDLPVSTHTQLGGVAQYLPFGWSARGYLDVFLDATVYGDQGKARPASSEIAIPTLELDLPVDLGSFQVTNEVVLRNPVQSIDVRLPGYSGRHALFAKASLFKGAMQLMTGAEVHLRSPAALYDYFPLTGVFFVGGDATEQPWQYSTDLFLAFKVQSFKAFIRADNVLANREDLLPATVQGYPVLRPPLVANQGAYLRMGVSFFLFD